jgi:protein TonB
MRYFVLLSMIAHGVLLALWETQHTADSTQPALAQNGNALSIALTPAPSAHSAAISPVVPGKQQTQPAPIPSPIKTTVLKAPTPSLVPVTSVASESPPVEVISADRTEKAAIIATVAHKPKQANSDITEPGMRVTNTASSRLQQSLTKALESHFHYPRLARKRGWQGTVEIGLNIATNGELSNIRVIQSSGYRVLDRAAVKSLKNLGNLTEAKEWLSSDYTGIFPVHYALVDG